MLADGVPQIMTTTIQLTRGIYLQGGGTDLQMNPRTVVPHSSPRPMAGGQKSCPPAAKAGTAILATRSWFSPRAWRRCDMSREACKASE